MLVIKNIVVGLVENLILESACRCFALRALVCIIQESIAHPPSCHSGSALFIQGSTFTCELVVHQHSWPLSVVEGLNVLPEYCTLLSSETSSPLDYHF
jgi:hypothetical protein